MQSSILINLLPRDIRIEIYKFIVDEPECHKQSFEQFTCIFDDKLITSMIHHKDVRYIENLIKRFNDVGHHYKYCKTVPEFDELGNTTVEYNKLDEKEWSIIRKITSHRLKVLSCKRLFETKASAQEYQNNILVCLEKMYVYGISKIMREQCGYTLTSINKDFAVSKYVHLDIYESVLEEDHDRYIKKKCNRFCTCQHCQDYEYRSYGHCN